MSFFKNETTLPILVTVMCGLIAVVTILYGYNTGKFTWLSDKTQKQNIVQEEKKEEEKITRTDYTEVARKTLDWIDKQRNEEGWYILERGCDFEKKTCDIVWDNKEGNKDGLIATWVRLNFYEQHKDPKDLEIVKKDIDIFYNKYKDDNLKDSLWICKITYEMAQSKYIDQVQKDKLKELCLKSNFLTLEELKNIQNTNTLKRKQISKQKNIWDSWDGYTLIMRGVNEYHAYPTDLIYKYIWSKDSDYLNQAKEYFKTVEELVSGDPNLEFENRCLLGMSGLDIYTMGDKEVKYIDYANNIFEKFIINSENNVRVTTPICGLLVKKLYQITQKNKYFSNLEFTSRILNKFYSDSQTNKVASENGFYKSNTGRIYTWYKNVAENGLITELIRN